MGAVDPEVPGIGTILARGAGWGSLLGMICSPFVLPVDDLLTFRDEPFSPYSFFIGLFAVPFGLLYGLAAGLISAACFVPFRSARRATLVARAIAATVGPLVVGAISFLVFHPSMSIGGNESIEHVRERVVLFYLFPCTAAAISGLVAGGRLARPADDWSPVGADDADESTRPPETL